MSTVNVPTWTVAAGAMKFAEVDAGNDACNSRIEIASLELDSPGLLEHARAV